MNSERLQNLYRDATFYLGGGVDSGVCMIPPVHGETKRYVAKFYKNHLPLPQLDFYTKTTNEASRIAVVEQWSWDFGSRFGKLAIKVVPTEEILFHNDLPVGIAEYIDAKSCGGSTGRYFTEPFEGISRFMDSRLGVRGIWVIPFNAKVTGKNGTLFVTDLCDEIMSLRNS